MQSVFFKKLLLLTDQTALITKDKKTIFLGFASDAGITRNQGRPGAKFGPDQIKTQLAKLPCPNDQQLFRFRQYLL